MVIDSEPFNPIRLTSIIPPPPPPPPDGGGGGAVLIVIDRDCVAVLPRLSVAITVNVDVALALGVPLIVLPESVSPVGRLPALIDQV
jgi:hypothetical protein